MSFALSRAVGRLRLVSYTTPRLFQQTISPYYSTPSFSFSSCIRTTPLLQKSPLRSVDFAAFATKTTPTCSKSAEKRHRQSEKRRALNRQRKNAVKIQMKKVLKTLDQFKREPPKELTDLDPVNPMMDAAFKAIDKAVKVGTLHKNTGARRKSRLTRARQRLLVDAKLIKPPERPEPISLVAQYELNKKAKREAAKELLAKKTQERALAMES